MDPLIHQYVARHAEAAGDSPAVLMGDECLTYDQLERSSNRLAHRLIESGCSPGDRVALMIPKSCEAIVAILAVLKASGIYVPIDVTSPAARVARIMRSADPATVLVMAGGVGLLAELSQAGQLAPKLKVGLLQERAAPPLEPDFSLADVATASDAPPGSRGSLDDIAHILFTSGSTGEPKGVAITHRNVVTFLDWAVSHFGLRPDDRISGHPPLHFDLSTFDIFGSLRAGASLHLVPPQLLIPRTLTQFILEHELTHWFSVPSAMSYLVDAIPDGGFPHLRRVLWCGEVLPTPVLVRWMRAIPQATFTNLYGPTEATIASSYFTVERLPSDPTAPIPIGVACQGEELVVRGEDGTVLPRGEIGELCIGGSGLSPGYWHDPVKTAAAFIPDPRPGRHGERIYRTGDLARLNAEGLVEFLGRRDTQIKSRGYRIELGEIETALNGIPEIRECAVVAVETDSFEGMTICVAYAMKSGCELSTAQLRAALAANLPSYMLPSQWRVETNLPKNVNGKIDRRRLREAFSDRASQATR